MKNLVQAVQDYAIENYSNGWDYIVECWSYADILGEVKNCRTEKGAIKKMREHVKLRQLQESNCGDF